MIFLFRLFLAIWDIREYIYSAVIIKVCSHHGTEKLIYIDHREYGVDPYTSNSVYLHLGHDGYIKIHSLYTDTRSYTNDDS